LLPASSKLLKRWDAPGPGAKGKRLGRSRVAVDAARIAGLLAHGRSWREITAEFGISKAAAQRAFVACPKSYELRLPTLSTVIA